MLCAALTLIIEKVDVFIHVLTERSITRAYKQRKIQIGNSQKWSRSLTGVVAARAFNYTV